MITNLYLAANLIPTLEALTNWGHLQLVGEDENGNLVEIEVQIPLDGSVTWVVHYDGNRNHVDPLNTMFVGDPLRYRRVPIDLGDRNANDVWNIIKQAANDIQDSGQGYALVNNSNTFVNSIFIALGLNLACCRFHGH